jgi:hypothetical protein
MQSPDLSTTGLRMPHTNPYALAPGANLNNNARLTKQKTWSVDFQGGASKGLLSTSNSCKTIRGVIIEGGSSSSEENKRPSIVHEQKTEEDAEDTSNGGTNA